MKALLAKVMGWWKRGARADLTQRQAMHGDPERVTRDRDRARAMEDTWRQQGQQGGWIP